MPILSEELLGQVSEMVASYIASARDRYLNQAIPLQPDRKAALAGFFTPTLLEEARVLILTDERVGNPDFYPLLRNMGFTDLPDQSTMAAITFDNCVVCHGPCSIAVLLHEFVHAEQ